jgi:hypothetical protein
MKKVKLLSLSSRIYMLTFLGLLILFFGVFYFIMKVEVQENIDEILFNRKNNIVEIFEGRNGMVSSEEFAFADFQIAETNKKLRTFIPTL